ncbi:MAG: MATE family efflux transporter [Eubacteriales bacterium]|nr:MATE family efflux transporter [Eubacteriales bacterium]
MEQTKAFTEGSILHPLLRFSIPVLFALCLQAMYGAVDLLVVGWFGTAADVSAVSTGSQILQTITAVITGLAMGTTILLGQKLGQQREAEAGDVIGSAVCLFLMVAVVLTVTLVAFASPVCTLMQAPAEAFAKTVQYVRICMCGAVFIVAYNVLGSIFRGMGDSKTPLLAVGIACVFNILGDLLFVAVLDMAASGAALATILAQAISVVLCLLIIRRRGGLPFAFSLKNIRPHKMLLRRIFLLGLPIALQDLLVSISFLVILAIVNSLGVIASAGIGVAEKLCVFIMLVPSAYMQSLSAFVAQNIGAQKPGRARRAMLYGMLTSFLICAVLAYLSFFHGDMLANIFAKDMEVIAASADYLKAYAIDSLLTPFLFCFLGYFNGCGKTSFVMAQGIIGAFCVRIPVSWMMSHLEPVSLFHIGLATPCSTVVQITLCVVYFAWLGRRMRREV